MQTYITEIKRSEASQQFVHPQMMIQNLLGSLSAPCGCGENVQHSQEVEVEINNEIRGLQTEISNIRSEVLEVENLLQTRDSLYKELDMLRQEREHIESEIQSTQVVETEIVKYSGYREMNERLRRRIFEVREFIQKMTFENQKIEEGVISNQYYPQQEEYLRRKEVVQPVYEGKRYNMTNFQSMMTKMHDKQQEAWRRVRRQEEDIERRNQEARSRKSGNFTYYSPKARTYYSPPREIY